MNKYLVSATLGMFMLAGCQTLGQAASVLTGSVQTVAPQTIGDAEKGLTIAHYTYQGISLAIQGAVSSGYLKGTDAALVKKYYDEAGALLDAADTADILADAQGINDKVQAATELFGKIGALLPKNRN